MPTFEEDVIARLYRIERILSKLTPVGSVPKRTWVKVSVITELTGWRYKSLQKARENGLIRFKIEDDCFFYLLESIPEMFIKKGLAS